MDYFLLRQGQVYGPYNIAQMRTFVSEGRVKLTDFARTGATAQWQPLHFLWNERTAVSPPWTPPAPPPPPPPNAGAGGQAVCGVTPASGVSRGNFLSWPFHQRAWFESLWMTLVWWIPLFGAGIFLNIGWSIEAARKRSWRAPDLLPRADRFGRMLLDGLTVSFFFCAFILIPVTVAWTITSLEKLHFVIPAVTWAWHYFKGEAVGNLLDVLAGVVLENLKHRAMIMLYMLISWPLFTAAGIRFVLTREAISFIHLPDCLGMLFANFGAFFQFFFLAGITAIAVTIGDAFVAATIIAAPMMILLGAAGIWVLTYLFAELAEKVQPFLQPQIHAAQSVMAAGARGPVR